MGIFEQYLVEAGEPETDLTAVAKSIAHAGESGTLLDVAFEKMTKGLSPQDRDKVAEILAGFMEHGGLREWSGA